MLTKLLATALLAVTVTACSGNNVNVEVIDAGTEPNDAEQQTGTDASADQGTLDTGNSNSTTEDMASADMSVITDAATDMSADMSMADAADMSMADAARTDGGADMTTVMCTPGASGGGNNFCENEYVCDGVDYRLECAGNTCTCHEDNTLTKTFAGSSCTVDVLREECGAPIPVPAGCGSVGSGGGNNFCEKLVTCDGVDYVFRCEDNVGCSCTVDGNAGPTTNETDCLNGNQGLIDCGADL